VSGGDQAKEIAIGYEMESTGDHREFDWLLKGIPQPAGKSTEQVTDNIKFSTDTIDINFVPRDFDKALHKDADTANPDFTEAMATAFLNTIPGGTLVEEEGA
jgi:phi13 family phage major tail protein